MRRSKAPSMKTKIKRSIPKSENCQDNIPNSYESEPEDESYKWGSRDNPEAAEKDCLSTNKRIFNIVWRDVTSKKHKTWKGDGTLEVNLSSMKAVAKDETGKYLGCSTKFRIQNLQEDYQMLIGGKEIEIQNEIKDEEEIYELRKRQVRNRYWGEEEYITPEMRAEEEKKPKGGFRFKPLLVIKPLEIQKVKEHNINFQEESVSNNILSTEINRDNEPCGSKDVKYQWNSNKPAFEGRNTNTLTSETETNRTATTFPNLKSEKFPSSSSLATYKSKKLICFLKPTELQHYLFQQIRDYYTNHKTIELKSIDLLCILRQICNHPSLIKHYPSNELVQHLTSSLPHWSEMGPFDSGKLEFVQHFLQNSIGKPRQRFIIIAKHTNTLNMIQGLCNFMHISCSRLNSTDSEDAKRNILDKCWNSSENTTEVLLTNTIHNLKDSPASLNKQQIIVFENIFVNINEIHEFEELDRATIYYLVTCFSIEEFLILPSQQNNSNQINYEEVLNLSNMDNPFCYIHTKINCNCCESCENNAGSSEDLEYFKSWQHLGHPFDEHFLKESALENLSGNLVSIFYKVDL